MFTVGTVEKHHRTGASTFPAPPGRPPEEER